MGRVFKTLWTEPAGGTTTIMDKRFYKETSYGELSFTKMRRFVVVRKRLHSCLCLAIYTYGGQGTTKSNVRPQDHAVVYVQGHEEPAPLPEEQSKKGAFPIIVEEPTETIVPMSRLDFSRIYTVEHNVKVLKVGRISPEHHERLEKYFVESIVPPRDSLDFYPELSDLQPDLERLDSSFKPRKPKFFKIGRVFSAWYSEAGVADTPLSHGVCSFVVIGEGAQSCTCLRARSYTLSSIPPQFLLPENDLLEHGLVYSNKPPKPGQFPFTKKKPLRVELSSSLAGGEIREPTLVHYGKVYTIDHDARAKDIGYLDSNSKRLLHEYSCEYTGSTSLDHPSPGNDASTIITNIDDALQLSSTLVQYICDVREPPEDCTKIVSEIGSTSWLLHVLKDRIKQSEDEQPDDSVERTWLAAFQPLSTAGGPIENFKTTLEQLTGRLVQKEASHKMGTPLAWTLAPEEITKALEDITKQRSRFVIALQNDLDYVVVDQGGDTAPP
jgi:hypothetical protein